jgi:hypothetical protein
VLLHAFLASELDGGDWLVSLPGRSVPGVRATATHWIGVLVGPKAGLDAVTRKEHENFPRQESNPGHSVRSLVSIPYYLPIMGTVLRRPKYLVGSSPQLMSPGSVADLLLAMLNCLSLCLHPLVHPFEQVV